MVPSSFLVRHFGEAWAHNFVVGPVSVTDSAKSDDFAFDLTFT